MKSQLQFIFRHPGFAGVCLVAGAEALMNATYGWKIGEEYPAGSYVMAALYLGNEFVKWMTAERLGHALGERAWSSANMAGALLIACIAISTPAHLGFIGLARGDSTAKREQTSTLNTSTKERFQRAREERTKVGLARSVAQIEQDISGVKRDTPKWDRLQAEKTRSLQAQKLDGEILALEKSIGGQTAVGVADPQVQVLGWFWKAEEEQRKQLLTMMLALSVELVTSLGFVVFGFKGRESMDLETLIEQGALTHPGADQIVPFRAAALERMAGASVAVDDVFQAYERWARAASKPVMAKPAFLRLIEALGVQRREARFTGWSIRSSFILGLAS